MIVSTWKMLNILDKELDKEETTTAAAVIPVDTEEATTAKLVENTNEKEK